MSIYFILSLTLLNSTAVRAARVVLPLYMLELGARPLTVGILAASFSVLPMFLSIPAGKFADRFGSRWLLMIGAIGGGVGLLIPYATAGFIAIFAAAALIGLSNGIYNVSLQNLVGLVSDPQHRARNFSNFSLMNSLSNFVGPLVAGFSIDHSGHVNACLYLALLTLVPVAMLAMRGGGLPQGSRGVAHASGGVRAMLADPSVRKVLATSSLLHTGQDLYQFYMPVYMHAAGLSASATGMVLAANAAAAFVIRLILPRLIAKFGEEGLLAYAFYAGGASLMLIPFFTSAFMLGVVSFVFGLGLGCSQPIITMLMFSNSAEGRSGEAMGLRMTVNHLTKLVGPVAFGAVGTALGLMPMFWLNALMMGAAGLLSRPTDRDQ